ncbi:MAG: hypothetical protein GY820_21390 [Gammaproteobacteria bacterium]|nr:hypothetical protein [Gammaproteobacteria bacterium]
MDENGLAEEVVVESEQKKIALQVFLEREHLYNGIFCRRNLHRSDDVVFSFALPCLAKKLGISQENLLLQKGMLSLWLTGYDTEFEMGVDMNANEAQPGDKLRCF